MVSRRMIVKTMGMGSAYMMAAIVLGLSGAPAAAQTAADARAVVAQFLANASGDRKAAMAKLKPSSADYQAVYKEPFATKLEAANKLLWDSGQTIAAKPDQTEIVLVVKKTDDLIDGKPEPNGFPGGYSKVLDQMKRGVTIARFKYVAPGESLGLAFDGLAHVNGRWVLMPKPWRAAE